ncbi:hypothetical protein KS4_10030 [Poriferisphaera corsica]|uniref:DUF3553 domain-containing protein n=1 Tax=Poriferisphaera corsica TaxID=2528020 RepID=A0A517YRW4_9BACT|nr:DUF3553 domain-containing protein [Poriferisphaera corsica]QDU32964.1 hypothetical protein KS4_10030 [Poriferisphaera corsica]
MNLYSTTFTRGDKVVHPKRPEWGDGVVRDASTITHEGAQAQRLAIDFANRGRVVINTAIAPLVNKRNSKEMNTGLKEQATGGWLGELEKAAGIKKSNELWDLPSKLSDPFTSLMDRLIATLETYRFSTDPRSLIDWAVIQTGLNDPLSKFTRHELEHAFPRFARDRDQHLRGIVVEFKHNGQLNEVKQIAAKIKHPAAKSAMDKVFKSL